MVFGPGRSGKVETQLLPLVFEPIHTEMSRDGEKAMKAGREQGLGDHDAVTSLGIGPCEGDTLMSIPKETVPE